MTMLLYKVAMMLPRKYQIMSNTLTKEDKHYIRVYIHSNYDAVSKVRFRGDAVHAYGLMPNSNSVGWFLVGYILKEDDGTIEIL